MEFIELDSIESTGGAISGDAVTTGLFVAGGAITAGWGIVSHVHTAMTIPWTTLGCSLVAGSCVAGGLYRLDHPSNASSQTINIDAQPVAG